MSGVVLSLTEADRQLIILAAAHLALRRPGWEGALRRLVAPIDEDKLYDTFIALRVDLATSAQDMPTKKG